MYYAYNQYKQFSCKLNIDCFVNIHPAVHLL